ncbi:MULTISPECIES: DUF3037 domain-containing protein [Flavobacterium]|jgi:hypothetical protein|uniref:DUF3037 domain-containing protein n=1 Tax=Flavobacterium TaxID=237 RepID=UPI00070004FC|nr:MULTISPECIES: DUF3037 domain-containing protein [Flavobacterium]PZQ87058.1 MAG: DUF3037 domain-containing protein [Flavobacterium johnsoniae]KQS47871.1 hypothetical protein ASG38_10645 [Flavobacterium sp. Leaf359]MBL7868533.1 DUF3037 domain-containing protein [Flavobacterium lindanitolerans]MDQ7962277.1 DUF3037 domain-containing protein [Flavobacterium lindanitolerans]THD33631.1 MAG: DUF3037 domain-containing protein [Flavobacterium johnsoniae]
MQDKHLYEYAIIRIVPKVEREEFVNTGIIVFCKKEQYIKVLYKIDKAKLQLYSDELDYDQLEQNLQAFVKIAQGAKEGGPIAAFDVPSRFRWMTAVRSSVIQTSRPHPGMCNNLEEISERLFSELVL